MAKSKPIKSHFVEALELLDLTFKAGDSQSMYCMMADNKAAAYNRVIAIGVEITEDLVACPQTNLMLAAVLECGPSYAITQLSPAKLLVRSAEFQAYIPCALPDSLSWPIPDAACASVDDRLADAIGQVAGLASTKGETVIEASIQLNAGSCIASNKMVIMEAWHGHDMPSGLLIPRVTADIIKKVRKQDKHLKSFGFSKETLTLYFDDVWVLSRLFQDKPYNFAQHLNMEFGGRAVPPDLFKSAKKVAPFSVDERVYVMNNFISSHPFDTKEQGSKLLLPISANQETHAARIYRSKNLAAIHSVVTLWDEHAKPDGTMFLGDNIRGIVHHEHFAENLSLEDEDIPF